MIDTKFVEAEPFSNRQFTIITENIDVTVDKDDGRKCREETHRSKNVIDRFGNKPFGILTHVHQRIDAIVFFGDKYLHIYNTYFDVKKYERNQLFSIETKRWLPNNEGFSFFGFQIEKCIGSPIEKFVIIDNTHRYTVDYKSGKLLETEKLPFKERLKRVDWKRELGF